MAERTRRSTDALALLAFCGFLFLLGLQIVGLVGADEPRYAQVAREMLARHDWVTPVLYGHPWLEKPPLYYWCAMIAYKGAGGVSDTAARLPTAVSDVPADHLHLWMVAPLAARHATGCCADHGFRRHRRRLRAQRLYRHAADGDVHRRHAVLVRVVREPQASLPCWHFMFSWR